MAKQKPVPSKDDTLAQTAEKIYRIFLAELESNTSFRIAVTKYIELLEKNENNWLKKALS